MNEKVEKPSWVKVRYKPSKELMEVEGFLKCKGVHTVCSSAICPNRMECFSKRTMTFLILGPYCTRSCRFCSVDKNSHKPYLEFESDEEKIVEAVEKFGLRHVTITSPTRDDLEDGGAGLYASIIKKLRELDSPPSIESLIPDFKGNSDAIDMVVESQPEVLAHNLETIPRLYNRVRIGADWERSMRVLRHSVDAGNSVTKTAFIAGLGETNEELIEAMRIARSAGVDVVVIGQYLRPTSNQMTVQRYVTLDEFGTLEEEGKKMGYKVSLAGPLYRSSYMAEKAYLTAIGK